MLRNLFILLILIAFSVVLSGIITGYTPPASLGTAASYYAEKGPGEMGATNLVTSVLITYRGLDTLGEVTVLFLVASILGFYLNTQKSYKNNTCSPLLYTASRLIFPFIFLTGIYIILNGHLSPGGGFQGGAFIASAFLLFILAGLGKNKSTGIFSFLESMSGVVYVLIGFAGIMLAGGFLDTRILPLGEAGKLISAGAIPVISILIGIKVGAELSSMIVKLSQNGQED